MDAWSEDEYEDGEVSFGARSRTRSGVTFPLPSTEDNEHKAERFRAELRSRRRQKGESLQKLYN